jgi:chromosome segregation ATPase
MADRTNPAPSTSEVTSFRLILSDPQVDGGQKVKTFSLSKDEIDAMTFETVVGRLEKHFGFAELAAQRNLSLATLMTGASGLNLVGMDGTRHVPIQSNDQLVSFFKTVRNSKMPSLEVKLLQPGGSASFQRKDARDRSEKLEEENFQMSKATQNLQQSVRNLERNARSDRDEAQRLVSLTNRDLGGRIEGTEKSLRKECKNVEEIAQLLQAENDDLRKALKELEKANNDKYDSLGQQLEDLNMSLTQKFANVQSEHDSLRQAHVEFNEGVVRQTSMLDKHAKEIQSLDEGKMHKSEQQAALDKMNNRITEEIAVMRSSLVATEKDLRTNASKQQAELEESNKAMEAEVKSTSERLSSEMKKLDQTCQSGVTQMTDGLNTTKAELQSMIKKEITELSKMEGKRLDDMKALEQKDMKELTDRVNELSARTEATFFGVEQRMDSLVKAERSRLGNIEKDLSESTAKLRSDCRADVERVRVDYEQEAARLDADLSDLHMKHDVVKQELDFFQSRLLEQRDWAQRQFAETATATRAAQVDAQEGVAAATKMAHVLRDDQVTFRDKMAKHVSLLQHSSDSYGDAINALETQRSRMRLELDAVLADHKAYVTDMDGWADDVRLKVERLFRAMEPPRCEWCITGAMTKMKDLKKPLSLRSPAFSLQGLRGLRLELYPHGTNQSPEGKAVLRMVMPPNSNVRYQVWLGKLTEGSREYESGGSLSDDLFFESWRDQVMDDGSLKVSIEILQDLTNNDESLSRAVRLEH